MTAATGRFSGVQRALLWGKGSQLLPQPSSCSSPRSSFWQKPSQKRQQCCCHGFVQMTDRTKRAPPRCVAEKQARQNAEWVCAFGPETPSLRDTDKSYLQQHKYLRQ